MIGLVGPADSVDLVVGVAREMQIEEVLLLRSYDDPEQAVGLARHLESLCSVLLFTGRVPFVMAAAQGSWSARTFYIPHEGTDLFRAIATLLLTPDHRGRLPRVSIDSIEPWQVNEAYLELGLDSPRHVIPLRGEAGDSVIDIERIAQDHRRLYESGKVDVCLTCIGAVHRRLLDGGVRTQRIVHSRIVIREALDRARLSMDLSRAEASQVAACILQVRSAGRSRRSLTRRLLSTVGRKYADMLDGRLVKQTTSELVILATRGAVERSLQSELVGRASAMNTELHEHLKLGIGFGVSASFAEAHARRALDAAIQSRQRVSISLQDGSTLPLDVMQPMDTSAVRAENLRAARHLKMSPTVIRRLKTVFRDLDPSSFTATELASSYGVIPRSARRLIALLRERGLVEECGIEKGAGAGRPQIAYRIAVDRIVGGA